MFERGSTEKWIEEAITTKRCKLSSTGALVAYSGEKTGRSPKDKRIVMNKASKDIWWSDVNMPIDEELYRHYVNYARSYMFYHLEDVHIVDAYAGWDRKHRVGVRIYCYNPYHALFMENMLIPVNKHERKDFEPELVIYNVGHLALDEVPLICDKDSSLNKTLIALKLSKGLSSMVIYGTEYAGEMKKGVLTYMMWRMPLYDHLTLHSSANVSKTKRGYVTFFFGLSGTGKCLGKNTPVLMYDGTIKMVQDIVVGDQIMGDDSKPRNILSVCNGREMLYKIENRKGTPYVVNESHLLSLKAHPDHLNQYKTDGDIIDISVKDYLTKLPKSYISTGGSFSGNGLLCGYRVPVNFTYKEVDLDPYMVGYWLGDGSSREPAITCVDKEIIDYFRRELAKLKLELKVVDDRGITYRIINSGENYWKKGVNAVRNALRKYHLFNNKHIPLEYKCNSRKVRLALLAGIMDSDGHYDRRGKGYDIVLKSEKLLDDVIYLCRSLGYCAYKKQCRKTCTNAKNGPVTGTYFRTFISGDNLSEIPCLLPRKKAENRTQGKSVLKYTIKVKKLEIGDYYGFEIDGNKRFLLGDFTVTHNTSLSADSNSCLIGDDEHVWTDEGIFNIEGGCYAKCIGLKEDKEPEIFHAIKYGAVLENVVMDEETRVVDYDDISITPNTRASYPLYFIEDSIIPAIAPHPRNIIFLTCDASGLLPPISKLTPEQAVFFFISGYTSKIPGTEVGVTKPTPTFSACFGEPFLVWSPLRYGELLRQKLEKYGTPVYLLNTGWIEGEYGVGRRIPIKYSRSMVDAIIKDKFTSFETFPVFDLEIPTACPDVPPNILNPLTNHPNPTQYLEDLKELYSQFQENYKRYDTQLLL